MYTSAQVWGNLSTGIHTAVSMSETDFHKQGHKAVLVTNVYLQSKSRLKVKPDSSKRQTKAITLMCYSL